MLINLFLFACFKVDMYKSIIWMCERFSCKLNLQYNSICTNNINVCQAPLIRVVYSEFSFGSCLIFSSCNLVRIEFVLIAAVFLGSFKITFFA